MNFANVIKGLKEGKSFRRQAESFLGKRIVMQIPQVVPASVVPRMTSLPENIKQVISTVGLNDETLGTIQYHDQVLIMTLNDFERCSATSYVPTWEDIFADDWVEDF